MTEIVSYHKDEGGMALPLSEDRAVVPSGSSPLAVSPAPAASIPSAKALRSVACQIRHRLSDMELRTNVSWPASSPAHKTSGYVISEVADWQLRQWLAIIENTAQGIEAFGQDPKGLDAKHESPVGNADAPDAPNPPHPSPNTPSKAEMP